MKLPDRFQFRAKDEPAFTHTAKLVEGEYQVKWARGFERHFMEKHGLEKFVDSVWNVGSAECQIERGNWIVVDEKPQEQSLPDEFCFKVDGHGCTYRMKLVGDTYRCASMNAKFPVEHGAPHLVQNVKRAIKCGIWVMVNVLTPEQVKANKEYREQIAQLNSSIRISEQNVEHQLRLQASYRERIGILNGKIVEE